MSLGALETIGTHRSLEKEIAAAFERLRDAGASRAALLFDVQWAPTMEVVAIIADEIERTDDLSALTLVHPSAAMTFIATAIGSRSDRVEVRAQRSVHDDGEEQEDTDATASRTMFVMRPDEPAEAFVRNSVVEAKKRLVRRFALVLDPKRDVPLAIADVLAEELLDTTIKEVGLVHSSETLDTVVAALRLRIPNVKIALARRPQKKTEP